jgi:hypothetical protein
MGSGSFLWVKRPGRGADHPPPPSAEVDNITKPPQWALGGQAFYRVTFYYALHQDGMRKITKKKKAFTILHGRAHTHTHTRMQYNNETSTLLSRV